jgi:2-(1,2-epoxy-1,2-dihydrophenyl)acetyl-CoA isomerase
MYETVEITNVEGVAVLRLNRPEVLNAWSDQMATELRSALLEAGDDPAVRAVVITGAGRAFSSGGDLKEELPRTPQGDVDLRRRINTVSSPLIQTVRSLPKPVIAAVNGPAAGIGCSLSLACDLILAAESAFFLLPFTRVGLVPDGAALTFLTARVGVTKASELAFLAERLPAAEAYAIGLVNAVHPDDELVPEALRLGARLAAGPQLAYANVKRLVNATAYPDLLVSLALEAQVQQEQSESGEYAEGVAAFREKRAPTFATRPS